MTWTLVHPARPWSLNMERRWHPHKRNVYVQEWRVAFYHLAKTEQMPTPVPRPVTVTANVELTKGYVMDAGNYYPAVKAAVDGLVDAGVIPDDTPEWVGSYTLHAPVNRAERDALILTVELEGCDIPDCDHKRSNRGYDMKPS